MSGVLFEKFPKLYRLKGPVIVTEKIDGTNACIIVDENGDVYAQSRTQLITPEKDNFGFARWVYENKEDIARVLGIGRHYGEWYGAGIQRNYGLKRKKFALFNTSLWKPIAAGVSDITNQAIDIDLGIYVVPVLYNGVFDTWSFYTRLMELKAYGSYMEKGFMNPEGIVIYDTQSGTGFKQTFEYDLSGKGGIRDEHGNVI